MYFSLSSDKYKICFLFKISVLDLVKIESYSLLKKKKGTMKKVITVVIMNCVDISTHKDIEWYKTITLYKTF